MVDCARDWPRVIHDPTLEHLFSRLLSKCPVCIIQNGWTPLQWAIRLDSHYAVARLLGAGVIPSAAELAFAQRIGSKLIRHLLSITSGT
jgi:hypothetical protein